MLPTLCKETKQGEHDTHSRGTLVLALSYSPQLWTSIPCVQEEAAAGEWLTLLREEDTASGELGSPQNLNEV